MVAREAASFIAVSATIRAVLPLAHWRSAVAAW